MSSYASCNPCLRGASRLIDDTRSVVGNFKNIYTATKTNLHRECLSRLFARDFYR
jgi:hypothetical protein